MPQYRKKPVVIDAIRFVPGTDPNEPHASEVQRWLSEWLPSPDWVFAPDRIEIPTLEGVMTANPGDWILRGVKGEFYPCKNDIFEATYEQVD